MSRARKTRPESICLRNLPTAGVGSCARPSLVDLILMAVAEAAFQESATREEVELVRGMGRQGGQGIDEVYRRYSQRVFWFIYFRVGERREDAEELTLDTFMSALNLCSRFDGLASVFAWLCSIAKLRIIDHHRRQTRQKRSNGEQAAIRLEDVIETAGSHSPMEQLLDRIGASQVLDLALDRLGSDEREALLLQHVEGLSVREIALCLKRTEKAVENMIYRAKVKLRDVIQGLLGEESSR